MYEYDVDQNVFGILVLSFTVYSVAELDYVIHHYTMQPVDACVRICEYLLFAK